MPSFFNVGSLNHDSSYYCVLRERLRFVAPCGGAAGASMSAVTLSTGGARKRAPSVQSVIAERAAQYGANTLTEYELVAAVTDASPIVAADALALAGSLRKLLAGDNPHGLTARQFARLKSAIELTRRHFQELMQHGPVLNNPSTTREYLHARLRDLNHEVFCVLYLDNRNRVISCDELFRGTIDGATVHTREVVKAAIAKNAAAVILAHNHPSGIAEPSQADEVITRRLKDALTLVDIKVLDHLIVGDGHCTSFAERGLL